MLGCLTFLTHRDKIPPLDGRAPQGAAMSDEVARGIKAVLLWLANQSDGFLTLIGLAALAWTLWAIFKGIRKFSEGLLEAVKTGLSQGINTAVSKSLAGVDGPMLTATVGKSITEGVTEAARASELTQALQAVYKILREWLPRLRSTAIPNGLGAQGYTYGRFYFTDFGDEANDDVHAAVSELHTRAAAFRDAPDGAKAAVAARVRQNTKEIKDQLRLMENVDVAIEVGLSLRRIGDLQDAISMLTAAEKKFATPNHQREINFQLAMCHKEKFDRARGPQGIEFLEECERVALACLPQGASNQDARVLTLLGYCAKMQANYGDGFDNEDVKASKLEEATKYYRDALERNQHSRPRDWPQHHTIRNNMYDAELDLAELRRDPDLAQAVLDGTASLEKDCELTAFMLDTRGRSIVFACDIGIIKERDCEHLQDARDYFDRALATKKGDREIQVHKDRCEALAKERRCSL